MLGVLASGSANVAKAQTLARPGWAGSGLTANIWWKHAVVYAIDPRNFRDSNADGVGDLQGIGERLDYLQALGVDALLLRNLQPAGTQAVDPAVGTLEDFDALVARSSRQGIRIVVELQPGKPGEDLSGAGRFWLSRGVAGLSLAAGGDLSTRQLEIRQLRAAANGYVGERIVIGDLDRSSQPAPAHTANQAHGHDGPQLVLDPLLEGSSTLNAATLRDALARRDADTGGAVHLRAISLGKNGYSANMARALATVLFSSQGGVLVNSGEELGKAGTPIAWGVETPPDAKSAAVKPLAPAGDDVAAQEKDPHSVLNWYRQMSVMMRSNGTLRTGANLLVNHDDQNTLVWVRRPQSPSLMTPPLVIICNLSDQTLHLSLKEDMQKLRLKGSFLRTVQRTDEAMGAMNLQSITLPAFGVFLGELRY